MSELVRGDRERGYFFDCPKLGRKAHLPTHSMYNMYRYNVAFSRGSEIKEEARRAYLDYGCGSGWGTELVGSMFELSVGFDLPGEHLTYADLIHHRANTLFTSDLEKIETAAPYDFITCFEVIEHVEAADGAAMVDRIARLSTPEACVMFSTPMATTLDGRNPSNPYHLHEYQPGELKAILDRYWKDVKITAAMGNMMIATCFEGR